MTSSHILVARDPSEVTVRVGTNYNGLGGELFRVVNIFRHPLYDADTEYMDFALLQLAKNITLKKGKKEIIEMVKQNETIADGTLAMVSGWGDTQNANESNIYLRGVVVPIVGNEICSKLEDERMDDIICAGDVEKGGKDSCQGK